MKNWRRLAIIFLCAIMIISGVLLVACEDPEEPPLPDEDPTIIYDNSQSNISMAVSVGSEKIEVKISSQKEDVGNIAVKVVSMKSFEYIAADTYTGLSDSASQGTSVGEYKLGTEATLAVDRYDNGYDNLYNKYYIVDSEGVILKGPVYATEIAAEVSAEPTFASVSPKGIVGGTVELLKDLQASNVTLNLDVEGMFYPNETWNDGKAEDVELTVAQLANAIEFVSNGKTYYFRKNAIKQFDAQVKQYYAAGARVSVVLSASDAGEYFPEKMTYLPYSTTDTQSVAINTGNQYGFEYYVALIEFLASRYTVTSQNNFANGFISTFIIGNQVDNAAIFNRISEERADLDKYMEEYSRLLRLTNLAVKKYHADITVAMPLSNAWAKAADEQSYAPKTMVEWLNNKTKLEGDYNWGIAPSVFGNDVTTSQLFEYDTDATIEDKGVTADANTTAILTVSNIELLDQFLGNTALTFDGKARNVYITAHGVSGSGNYDGAQRDVNGEQIQAGVIAATWYKISQLESIACYNYAVSAGEFGLIGQSDEYKPSYLLYRYIDTQYSQIVASQYLGFVNYYKQGVKVTPSSYTELLNTLGTSYNVSNFDWSKANPREIQPIYDWETSGDMSGNYALDGSFINDGFAHTITVGTRAGVTVKYSVNGGELTTTRPTRTEVGSDVVLVNFYNGETLLGTRQVKLTVGAKVEANKPVYNYGEAILFNVVLDKVDGLSSRAWVGLVEAEQWNNGQFASDHAGLVASARVFKDGQYVTRTISLGATVPAGEYYVYYSATVGYDQVGEVFKIKVLAEGEESGLMDLSEVKLADAKFDITEDQQQACRIEAQGVPADVTVEYIGNEQTDAGTYNVCLLIKKDGILLEKRYAVMTLTLVFDEFEIDKTTFVYGEAILVTAIASATKTERTLKVGLFEKDTDNLIAFYFVKDTANGHLSGRTYNILSAEALVSGSSSLVTVGAYKLLKSGEYTLRLYVDGQEAINSVDITVEDSLTLEVNKTVYELDEEVLATAKGISDGGTPLFGGSLKVGLYSKNDPNPITNPHPVVPVFGYVVDANTSEKQLVLQQCATTRPFNNMLPDGEYVVYLLIDSNGTCYELAKYEITVGDPSIELVPFSFVNGEDGDGKRVFSYDEDVQIKIDRRTVSPSNDQAWILFSKLIDGKSWVYVNNVCNSDGIWTIDKMLLPAGESYKLTLYYDYGNIVVATADFYIEALPADTIQILNATTDFVLGDTLQVKVDPTYLADDTWLAIYPARWTDQYEEARKYVTSVKVSDLAESNYEWTVDLVGNVQLGTNYVVLFKGYNSYVEAVDPIAFTVAHNGVTAQAPTILGDKTTFQGGDMIRIKFDTSNLANVFIFTWIAIYFADDVNFSIYLEYAYVTDLMDEDYVWSVDTFGYPTGEYAVVFLVDYDGTIKSDHVNFTIENGEEFLSIVGGQTEFAPTDTVNIHFVDPLKFIKQDEWAWIGIWRKSEWTGVQSGYLAPWAYCREYINNAYNPTQRVSNNTWSLDLGKFNLGADDYVVVVCAGGENVATVEFTIKPAQAETTVATSMDYFVDTGKHELEE